MGDWAIIARRPAYISGKKTCRMSYRTWHFGGHCTKFRLPPAPNQYTMYPHILLEPKRSIVQQNLGLQCHLSICAKEPEYQLFLVWGWTRTKFWGLCSSLRGFWNHVRMISFLLIIFITKNSKMAPLALRSENSSHSVTRRQFTTICRSIEINTVSSGRSICFVSRL